MWHSIANWTLAISATRIDGSTADAVVDTIFGPIFHRNARTARAASFAGTQRLSRELDQKLDPISATAAPASNSSYAPSRSP